jgi:ubiquinone/menaquinone biosynthesis C-methylase UbiE
MKPAATSEAALSFDDSAAYERFVGRWGRAAGTNFLDWLAPPPGARWLEVGCGTGLFTELILDKCAPATVLAIDQAPAQIDHACRKPVAVRAQFRVADAQALPFPDGTFDVVASALVINFIPDRARALSEMRRMACVGGTVAGYVWDFAEELSPSGPFRLGLREVVADMPALPGTQDSTLGALCSLFQRAGFEEIAARSFDVMVNFPDFEAFWVAQTPSYAPTTKIIAAMTKSERSKVMDAIRSRLQAQPDGRIEYSVRANAIRGRRPA